MRCVIFLRKTEFESYKTLDVCLVCRRIGIFGSDHFLSYILICAALFKSRFSRLVIALAFGAAGIVVAGVNIAIMLPNQVKVYNDEDGGVNVVLEFNGDFSR